VGGQYIELTLRGKEASIMKSVGIILMIILYIGNHCCASYPLPINSGLISWVPSPPYQMSVNFLIAGNVAANINLGGTFSTPLINNDAADSFVFRAVGSNDIVCQNGNVPPPVGLESAGVFITFYDNGGNTFVGIIRYNNPLTGVAPPLLLTCART
jgi:hypothetical protein